MPAVPEPARTDLLPVAVVVNPRAGSAGAADLPPWVRRRPLLAGERLEPVLHELLDGGARTIGVLGGDGSQGCAAGVAIERGTPLLPIAGGTLNHFARELGLDAVPASLAAVRGGRVARVDVGRVGDTTFVNNASLGLYAELVTRREQIQRRGVGKWAALAIAMALSLRGASPLELEIDGRPERAYIVFLGNNRYESLGLGGRSSLQEGVLDLMVLRARGRLPRLSIVLATLLGQLQRSRRLRRRTAREVRITLAEPTVLAHDGEVDEAAGELRFRSLPRALAVVTPPDGARG